MIKKERKRNLKAIIFFSALSLAVLIIVLFSSYNLAFAQRIYPRVVMGDIDLGGKTRQEAKRLLSNRFEALSRQGLCFEFNGQVWKYLPEQLDLSYNIQATVDQAFQIGREKSWSKKTKSRIRQAFKFVPIYAKADLNKKTLNGIIDKISNQINIAGRDSSLVYVEDRGWQTEKEVVGQSISKDRIAEEIAKTIVEMKTTPHVFSVQVIRPIVTAKQLGKLQEKLDFITASGLNLQYQGREFTADKKTIASWIDLVIAKKPDYIINNDKIRLFIQPIAKEINKEPIDAKLSVSNGRAVIFQSAQDGLKLDQEKLSLAISRNLASRLSIAKEQGTVLGVNSETGDATRNDSAIKPENLAIVELPVNIIKPNINDQNIDILGIKELVTQATTDFRKSPKNRRHNIELGTKLFNGVLLKPGEEFSALRYLGQIDGSNGFLPELVIKEDATIPEFGGGLCQVSTTMFRAALNAGFPITERVNHKYRVSYYEPPIGMDATIYDPSPDLKFVNDSSAHILIQGYVKGTKITFEFYGAKDGRKVEMSEPQVYDFVSPPPPIYTPDPSLAPGETKVVEKEHQGAKANFNYKVINPDGSTRFEKTFASKYKPWQARYLTGPTAEPAPAPAPDPNAQTADPNAPVQSPPAPIIEQPSPPAAEASTVPSQ